jgi:UDP-N-acetylglucosamine 2-epimerase (non-hydrolysing)
VGISVETTVMNFPFMTLRNNKERPEPVLFCANELIGSNPKSVKPALEKLFVKK